MSDNDLKIPALVCPDCLTPLIDRKENLQCPQCSARLPVAEGIPDFLASEADDAYIMAGQEGDINKIALTEGWPAAAQVAASRTNNPVYQLEYISSEARADFRFLMPSTPDDIVLDLGSGWGNISVAFARFARHVFAIDSSLNNLRFVQIRAHQEGVANITPLRSDAGRIPLPPDSCNIALMVGVLEWVAWNKTSVNPRQVQLQVLQNVREKLVTGGCLYIGIENRFAYKYFLGSREPHTRLRFVSLLPHPIANWYSRLKRGRDFMEVTYSLRGIKNLLQKAGFGRVQIYYPIPGYQIFRFITDLKSKPQGQYLFEQLRSYPKFSETSYVAARLALGSGLLKWFAPCFSVFAYKD